MSDETSVPTEVAEASESKMRTYVKSFVLGGLTVVAAALVWFLMNGIGF
ncbi:MAG: hypothetical protein AAFT19_05830 [Pseudomonadota bacterium]